jgi:hypothetical protein
MPFRLLVIRGKATVVSLEEGYGNAANVDGENARRVAAGARISRVFSRRSINAQPVV